MILFTVKPWIKAKGINSFWAIPSVYMQNCNYNWQLHWNITIYSVSFGFKHALLFDTDVDVFLYTYNKCMNASSKNDTIKSTRVVKKIWIIGSFSNEMIWNLNWIGHAPKEDEPECQELEFTEGKLTLGNAVFTPWSTNFHICSYVSIHFNSTSLHSNSNCNSASWLPL